MEREGEGKGRGKGEENGRGCGGPGKWFAPGPALALGGPAASHCLVGPAQNYIFCCLWSCIIAPARRNQHQWPTTTRWQQTNDAVGIISIISLSSVIH